MNDDTRTGTSITRGDMSLLVSGGTVGLHLPGRRFLFLEDAAEIENVSAALADYRSPELAEIRAEVEFWRNYVADAEAEVADQEAEISRRLDEMAREAVLRAISTVQDAAA